LAAPAAARGHPQLRRTVAALESRGWLARTLTAPRGPQWCCEKCQSIHAAWAPICSNCGGFDTLSWREPVEASGSSATQSELLPLLVGMTATSAAPAGTGQAIDAEVAARSAD